jgi:hypothetical protein
MASKTITDYSSALIGHTWLLLAANYYSWLYLSSQSSQSQSHTVTHVQSASKSWCRARPSGAHDKVLIALRHLRSCFHGVPSLTIGRVCHLYVLLALASAVFLRYKSLGTHDHILLSQIWDFPFHRLLWLAGSQWRYSIPPPYGENSFIRGKNGAAQMRPPQFQRNQCLLH